MKVDLYLLSGALALGVLCVGQAALGQTGDAMKGPANKAEARAHQKSKPAQTAATTVSRDCLLYTSRRGCR